MISAARGNPANIYGKINQNTKGTIVFKVKINNNTV